MKTLNLAQGSDEWLAARLDYLCASEAPVVMGEFKFMTRNQLLDLKKGWVANPADSFKQRLFDKGHEHEEHARNIFEVEMLEDFPPVVGLTVVNGMELLASFDGLAGEPEDYKPWEHKDFNETLLSNVRNKVLEPLYYWQLEHQMLVAGCDEIIFMCSDGTLNKRADMIYQSVPERRKQLIEGWQQFLIDLNHHEIEAKQEVVIAAEAEDFPLITYSVEGSMVISNINNCLPLIKERAALEMSRVLESDQDFADKDKLNKATKVAREKIKKIIADVQGEFVSYSEFAQTASKIDSILQKMQSQGEKQVKQQKEAKKQAIINARYESLNSLLEHSDSLIAPMSILRIMQVRATDLCDFSAAMKGKRTIESWTNAADQELTKAKLKVNEVMSLVIANSAYLKEEASEHGFLFSDAEQLVNQHHSSFTAVVKQRIAEHKKAEEQRLLRIKEQQEAQAVSFQSETQEMQQAVGCPLTLVNSAPAGSYTEQPKALPQQLLEELHEWSLEHNISLLSLQDLEDILRNYVQG